MSYFNYCYSLQGNDLVADNNRVRANQDQIRYSAKFLSIGIIIGAMSAPSLVYAVEVVTPTQQNSTLASQNAQRVVNAFACASLATTCQKVTEPRTKVALIACGIAIGWCGKYVLTGK